jgi:DNA repair ATPase RecN
MPNDDMVAGGPILYVDRARLEPSRIETLKVRIAELVELVDRSEPQILWYGAYLDEAAMEMSVVHLHRDSSSLERHMQVIEPALPGFAGLLSLTRSDVYGPANEAIADRLRRKAEQLGGATLTFHHLYSGITLPGVGEALRR